MTRSTIDFELGKGDSDASLRTWIALDFFLANHMMYLDAAVEKGATDEQLVEEIARVSALSFLIADTFIAQKNHVTGTTKEDEYDYV